LPPPDLHLAIVPLVLWADVNMRCAVENNEFDCDMRIVVYLSDGIGMAFVGDCMDWASGDSFSFQISGKVSVFGFFELDEAVLVAWRVTEETNYLM
jgi:hypothetical protein